MISLLVVGYLLVEGAHWLDQNLSIL